jgi:hypothetical protein
MARFICWHIQEQTQGGLDPETAKHFDAAHRRPAGHNDRGSCKRLKDILDQIVADLGGGHDFGRPTSALPARREAFNSSGSHGMRRPQAELVVERALRRQVLRDRPPLTAGRQNVDEAVHHLTHHHSPLATAALARRNERFNQLPFGVGQIARIS